MLKIGRSRGKWRGSKRPDRDGDAAVSELAAWGIRSGGSVWKNSSDYNAGVAAAGEKETDKQADTQSRQLKRDRTRAHREAHQKHGNAVALQRAVFT